MSRTIMLNGARQEVESETLLALLDELGFAGAVVATAVNEEFVPRDARAGVAIQDGDRLEIVAPLQGG